MWVSGCSVRWVGVLLASSSGSVWGSRLENAVFSGSRSGPRSWWLWTALSERGDPSPRLCGPPSGRRPGNTRAGGLLAAECCGCCRSRGCPFPGRLGGRVRHPLSISCDRFPGPVAGCRVNCLVVGGCRGTGGARGLRASGCRGRAARHSGFRCPTPDRPIAPRQSAQDKHRKRCRGVPDDNGS